MVEVTPEPEEQEAHRLRDSILRFGERRRRWGAEGARTLVLAVRVTGIGWSIAVPGVLGFAVGHWLDDRYGMGIALSAGLGLLGLALGCYGAWRYVARQRDDEPSPADIRRRPGKGKE